MPRDGSDVYSKAAGTTAVSGETISSAKFNATVDDIVNDLNLARPIAVGGTGATTAAGARTALGVDTAISDATTPIESDIDDLEARDLSALVKIETIEASGAATVEFTGFDSTKYSGYVWKFGGVSSSASPANIAFLVSTDGGSTFETGSIYAWRIAGGSLNSGEPSIRIGTNVTNGNEDFYGSLEVTGPDIAGGRTNFIGQFAYTGSTGPQFLAESMGGGVTIASEIDAIRFFASSGSLSGTFSMYGIAK